MVGLGEIFVNEKIFVKKFVKVFVNEKFFVKKFVKPKSLYTIEYYLIL